MTAQGNALGELFQVPLALKGRNKTVWILKSCALSGLAGKRRVKVPGRCPGLACSSPLGCSEACNPMTQRRVGFTLVEIMVSMALTIFLLTIMAQAFVLGTDTFRTL